MKDANLLQKIFTCIGFVGVALLIPGMLYAIGFEGPVNWMESTLGRLGDRSLVTVIAFALMSLMFVFGGGHNISATFVGFVIGFFLISTAVQIGFMNWFRNWALGVSFLSSAPLNYIVGIATVVAGVMMSFNKKIPFWGELAGLVLTPVGILLLCGYMNWFRFTNDFNISMDEGIKSLSGLIDKKYMQMPTVKKYVQEVSEDENLTKDEKEDKVKELQEKIDKMEEEQKLLEDLKKQNEEFKEKLKEQKNNLKSVTPCATSNDAGKMSKKIADAVVPGQPCVRDFAVSLVKKEAGSYHGAARGIPSAVGLHQLCALHLHTSSNWQYVNDPTVLRDDFYSPADRTISIGLAGDCDDFATLNASCVEAIGGISRVICGQCSAGGHAWGEVLIGKQAQWDMAVKEIRKYYNKPNMMLTPSIDAEGFYWLPLDWIMGQKSCAEHDLMELYTSAEQVKKDYK